MAKGNFAVSRKLESVIMPYHPGVAAAIPHATVHEKGGKKFHQVPHRPTETKLLNNLGFVIPNPILTHYDWSGVTPFESQKYTAALMVNHNRGFILNEMGTGKTLASLLACEYLMKVGEVKRVLIAAPLSTLNSVWAKEIFTHFPHRTTVVLHGSREKRKELLNTPADYYVINHDGIKLLEDELIMRGDIDAVIVDELAVLRNARSVRWKAFNRVLKKKKRAWGMTGSPMPKSPMDAYGQIKLLKPENVPTFMTAFKMQTMTQLNQFIWIPKPTATEDVFNLMQPAVRYTREECMDLPPTTYSVREVVMTAEQKKAYKQMAQEFTADFAKGTITAANSAVKASKLLQICCGFAYGGDDDITVELDASSRIGELKDIIEESSNKVIVFVPFRKALEILERELKKDFNIGVIHGGVSSNDRSQIFNLFQNGGDIDVILAQPNSMAHGLTLTAADTIVWYAPVYDLEVYGQANARITRPGQKNNTHIIHIQSTNLEQHIYKVLQSRGDLQNALLDMFKSKSL